MAVLYCFLNGEVRTEMSRALRSRDWPRFCCFCGLLAHSGSTCSCNAGNGNGKQQQQTRRQQETSVGNCWCRRLLGACRHALHHSHHRSTHSMASTQGLNFFPFALGFFFFCRALLRFCCDECKVLASFFVCRVYVFIYLQVANGDFMWVFMLFEGNADIGIGTRGGSLASSRGYLEAAGLGPCSAPMISANGLHDLVVNCDDDKQPSLLSLCSHVSILQ